MSRLTVIIPVRGRPEFVERLLRHARSMPYEFLVVHNNSLPEYFSRTAEALDDVKTPYVMRADDDDFLSMPGIERALDFLDSNPDYIAASGRIAGFSVYSGLKNLNMGLTGSLNRRYPYYAAEDLSQAGGASRLECGALRLWVYYAVHRTQALQTVTKEIAEINFSDLLLYEAFHVMRSLTLGKVHLDTRSISYFKQYGTSTSAAGNRDWPHNFLRSTFTEDVAAMIARLGYSEIVLAALDEKFRQFLRANFSVSQQIKWALRDYFPKAVSYWQNRKRPFAFREWQHMHKQLKSAGASDNEIAVADDELATIKRFINDN